MNFHSDTTIFECQKRIDKLTEFRSLVVSYFSNLKLDYSGDPVPTDEQMKIRSKINFVLKEMNLTIMASGVNPVIQYSPPPMIGGYIQNINIIQNIFNLTQYRIPPVIVVDKIEESLGVYENERTASLIRTINPFYWTSKVIKRIISIPFSLLESAGFNTENIEQSFLGKTYKFVSELILFGVAILTGLQILGYSGALEEIKKTLDNLV